MDFFADWSEEDYFLNCGSFDARYSKKFIELVGGKYRKIVNLECDGENYLTTCENMKEYSNVENIKTGVYKKKTVLRFNALGNGTSYITKDGQFQDTVIEAQVDTIDNIIADDDVTFIKMDIEGSEYDALIGAEKTIKRCAPRMAICIYHNVFDFVRIPHLIQSYEKRYHFVVRHYTDTLCETVLYAWVED